MHFFILGCAYYFEVFVNTASLQALILIQMNFSGMDLVRATETYGWGAKRLV
jgi:hypothetical protein